MKANYHTHTYRCMHARGTDEDYVKAAVDGGFDVLGFADHAPWRFDSDFVSGIRMKPHQLPDYVASIAGLQEKYRGQIRLYTGLEIEYFPRYRDQYSRLRDAGIQYFILGQHYLDSEETGPYVGRMNARDDGEVMRYAEAVAEGLATGLFRYLCHPDLFLRSSPEFTPGCERAADVICQAALEAHVPLEFNLLGFYNILCGDPFGYPNVDFWNYIRRWNNQTILGVDAHNPELLNNDALWDSGLDVLNTMGFERLTALEGLNGGEA